MSEKKKKKEEICRHEKYNIFITSKIVKKNSH